MDVIKKWFSKLISEVPTFVNLCTAFVRNVWHRVRDWFGKAYYELPDFVKLCKCAVRLIAGKIRKEDVSASKAEAVALLPVSRKCQIVTSVLLVAVLFLVMRGCFHGSGAPVGPSILDLKLGMPSNLGDKAFRKRYALSEKDVKQEKDPYDYPVLVAERDVRVDVKTFKLSEKIRVTENANRIVHTYLLDMYMQETHKRDDVKKMKNFVLARAWDFIEKADGAYLINGGIPYRGNHGAKVREEAEDVFMADLARMRPGSSDKVSLSLTWRRDERRCCGLIISAFTEKGMTVFLYEEAHYEDVISRDEFVRKAQAISIRDLRTGASLTRKERREMEISSRVQQIVELIHDLTFPPNVARSEFPSLVPYGYDHAEKLIELQGVMRNNPGIDLARVKKQCKRIFKSRNHQTWPPKVVKSKECDRKYGEMVRNHFPNELPTPDEAVAWANDLIRKIDAAKDE